MKIMLLLTSLSSGGGERVASDLSLNFPKDFDVSIVLFQKKVSYPYRGVIFSLGVPERSKIAFLLALFRFKKLLLKEKPDYVVSFGKLPNLMNIFSGSRSVLRVDNFYSLSCFGLKGYLYQLLVKIFFNKAEKIVVVSKESADDLIKNFGIKKEKIRVIYNPLNIEQIQLLLKESLKDEYKNIFENPVVVTMGQLGRQKNQKQLIRAFSNVKKNISNAQLVVLGRGPLENDLKKLAAQLGLKNDIHFLGWLKNPFALVSRTNVFVLSSLWEGLPCSLLEAMACGVPVVSFDCSSGPREILAPGTDPLKKTEAVDYAQFGVLVKPKDEKMLVHAIVKVLSDRSLYENLKEKSSKRAVDFEAGNIIKEWDFLR